MSDDQTDKQNSPPITSLRRQLAEGSLGRRDFVRFATLLGVAAPAAYAMAGLRPAGAAPGAAPETTMPKGGTLRVGTRVKDLKNPHTYSWGAYDSNISRQVVEYLTFTDEKNITHPYLLSGWDVSPDLKTWTLKIRPGIKWHNGQDFTADDVVWNLKQLTDAAVGSSFVGLVKGYLLDEAKENGKATTKLWDANAIEKVDSHTVRLNCKAPQISVPEHLFHYPAAMLYPGDKGVFQPGAQGTGAFEFVEVDTGKRARVRAHKGYWGDGPYLDAIEYVDLGDDPAAAISALASRQLHGLISADPTQYDALGQMPHLQIYRVATAETAVMRFRPDAKPFNDARVRRAMRLALDSKQILEVAVRGLGLPGDHVHVSPAQPDYDPIKPMGQDVAEAKRLLAEAGFPNGLDTEMFVPNDLPWIVAQTQAAAEQWKAAGIRVKLNVVPGAQYWDVWTKVPFGATVWYHRPLGLMVLDLGYRTGVPWNESGYSNPALDKLLDEADGTLDMQKRRAVIGKVEAIMHEDGPITQPIWRDNFTFFDKSVRGFSMHPSSYFFGNRIALGQTT